MGPGASLHDEAASEIQPKATTIAQMRGVLDDHNLDDHNLDDHKPNDHNNNTCKHIRKYVRKERKCREQNDDRATTHPVLVYLPLVVECKSVR